MLDLHAHFLPGIDDGPRTLEESLGLLRAYVADGVTHVIATPHIYPGVFDNHWQGIADRFNEVAEHVGHLELPISLSFAAEVRLCGEMIDWLQSGDLPVMTGLAPDSFAVLVELPDGIVPVGADRILSQMVRSGLTPIIAHPERNRAIMESPDKAVALVRLGCKLQLTAGSLLGDFGDRAMVTAFTLLEHGSATLVASDAHNLRHRMPRMSAARALLTERYGADTAHMLTLTNPMAIAGRGVQPIRASSGGISLRELPMRFRPKGPQRPSTGAWVLKDLPPLGADGKATDPLSVRGLSETLRAADDKVVAGIPKEWVLPEVQLAPGWSVYQDTEPMSMDELVMPVWEPTHIEPQKTPGDPVDSNLVRLVDTFGSDRAEDLDATGNSGWVPEAGVDSPPPDAQAPKAAYGPPPSAPGPDGVPVLDDAIHRGSSVVIPFAAYVDTSPDAPVRQQVADVVSWRAR